MAQCGRCGPDGGNDPNARPRVTFRPQRPFVLPDGLGTIQAQLRIDNLTPAERPSSYSATTELLLDVVMARPVRVTEIALRRAADPISFDVTAANPIDLPAGASTIVLRGSTFPMKVEDNGGWTLFLRTEDRTAGYSLAPSLNVIGSEAIAMAEISPPRDLDAAMVSLRASYARTNPGSPISAAEIQYQVRYRAGSASTSITGLSLRSVAAFGPVVIEPAIPVTAVSAGSTGTLSFRQILDPSNAAAMAGLEAMLQNPSSLFAQLRTSGGSGGALLRKPESFTYSVKGTRIASSATPESAQASGLVTVELLRDETGKALAGLAHFGLGASGFTRPGTALSGISFNFPPFRTLAVQSLSNNTTVSASGDTSFYQEYPLLGDDPLLAYLLTPSTFSARLNTAVDALGAITLTAKEPFPQLSSPAMAITQLIPAISTPGSIVSIFGRGFPGQANQTAVTVEGSPVEVLYASPTQVNVRLPETLSVVPSTGPSIRRTLLLVNIPQTTAASSILTVDLVEPFVLFGPAIYFADSINPVQAATPAAAGDRLDIYCTGIALPRTPADDIKYFVKIGSRTQDVQPAPVPGVPGVWKVQADVPTGLAAGTQSVFLYAEIPGHNNVKRRFPVVERGVPLAVK